ncbi:MAG: PDZ domain-containing protein [Chlamydiia bacterium]|nr:PDZ domain-containing protein [Chlamydiia bacterium]
MFRSFFLSLFLFFTPLLGIQPPDLSSKDVFHMIDKILEAHVSYKSLTPLLVKRALEEYIDILDPAKIYFLKEEISALLNINDDQLTQVTEAISQGDYSYFAKIHDQMIFAIYRRSAIDLEMSHLKFPENVPTKELKGLNWAQDIATLKERLLKIKAIQLHAAQKLVGDTKEKALQRIQKRQSSREEEILTEDKKLREQFILSNILRALTASFDNHTAYFTPQEAKQFIIQLQQRLFGVGAQLRDNLDGFLIVKILEGGPASRSELKKDDLVIAINDEPVVGLSIFDVVELIRGPEGTKVTLTVIRQNQEEILMQIPITRGEVVIKEARLESNTIPYGNGVLAHIKLHAFYQDPQHSSATDLMEELTRIKRQNALKGVILDLRQNVGGVLPQAVAVTGLFITKGIVCSIKDNLGHIEHLRNIDGKTVWDGPLVVLTSKISASAAEIVAQTLQDYGRGIVVGDSHTFGKGTFQTFTLDQAKHEKVNPKGEYKVTRGRYYTVSGKSPQLVGVRPDIVIPGLFSEMEIGEQYAKYPVENDSITEHFNDDLSDIPPSRREQINWLYKFNLQTRLRSFTKHLPQLKENSERRIALNALYQNFLEEIKKEEDHQAEVFELYSKADLQLEETVNVMKDLILLVN